MSENERWEPLPLVLIGISGRAGAGKGELARALRERHGVATMSFAEPLKAGLCVMCGWTLGHFDRERKELVDEALGVSPRWAAQTLGTEWGRERIGEHLWVDLMRRRLQGVIAQGRTRSMSTGIPRVAIDDVRFENEAQAVRWWGGTLVQVFRQGNETLDADARAHASEAGVMRLPGDMRVLNDGSLADLARAADEIYAEALGRYEHGCGRAR